MFFGKCFAWYIFLSLKNMEFRGGTGFLVNFFGRKHKFDMLPFGYVLSKNELLRGFFLAKGLILDGAILSIFTLHEVIHHG